MKPRLRRIAGLWYCQAEAGPHGLGYTPTHAWDDWTAHMLQWWRAAA